MQKKKHVYIIHGYNANSSSHWFPWLKQQLEQEDFLVDIIDMPYPMAPSKEEWVKKLNSTICQTNENTYFIAHSLGCIALLHYFSSLETVHIGGFLLVSGFSDKLVELPVLDNFIYDSISYNKIIGMSQNRLVMSSTDDPIVPLKLVVHLREQLEADFYIKNTGGHFLKENGFASFPLVYQLFKTFF